MAYKTKYKPKNKSKYIGDPSNIICRSLWERRFCKYLDENVNIVRWGSEEIIIPYYSPVDKKNHRYYPDFIVEKRDKNNTISTLLIEIKPEKQTKPPKKTRNKKTYLRECLTYETNRAKWSAAEKVCSNKGWQFLILTEKDIFPKPYT